ncbi:MAG: sporulation protein [Thermoplasmata archaeon]|nr:sporulation protein [Thermoplasmata archaeon]
MDVLTAIEQARDAVTVRRVYGEPVEHDGVTVIPAAVVQGGGGGGGGTGPDGNGTGGGWGVRARPVGAYVFGDGRVRWEPAVDLTHVILGGQLVAVAGLLTLRFWLKSRARRRR